MKQSKWTQRGLALLLAAVLLCGAWGCGDNSPVPPTGDATATTTAPVAEVTTTAPTAAPTTAQPEPELPEIGGMSFTIDGLTFEMGQDASALLAHLGVPKEVREGIPQTDADNDRAIYYTFDHVKVVVYKSTETADGIIYEVDFTDDHYAFDGVRVGDTVRQLKEQLDGRIAEKVAGAGLGWFGGATYNFTQSENRMVEWSVLLDCDDDVWSEVRDSVELHVNICIKEIRITYNIWRAFDLNP